MTGDAAALLVRYDDFSGGHYGAVGARRCDKNQWGGRNMVLSRSGAVVTASASRPLQFENLAKGRIRGIHWAWGVDGLVYFVQDDLDSPGVSKVRRFEVDPEVVITIEDVGDIPVPARRPAWCDLGGDIYLSSWSDATYRITVSAPSLAALTSGEGPAPGARALAAYGERLYYGGLDDARFNGNRGNRIAYSDPADFGTVPDLSFFDAGADNIECGALVPMADQLVIILEDQEMWVFRGTPGGASTLRRAYGHHRGSAGIRIFENDHAIADPSQARVWFYDHVVRGPASFNGAQVSRNTAFGAVSPDRTGTDRIEGNTTLVGGPGDFFMDRVVMPRAEGEAASGEALELVRLLGAFSLVERRVVAGRF